MAMGYYKDDYIKMIRERDAILEGLTGVGESIGQIASAQAELEAAIAGGEIDQIRAAFGSFKTSCQDAASKVQAVADLPECTPFDPEIAKI